MAADVMVRDIDEQLWVRDANPDGPSKVEITLRFAGRRGDDLTTADLYVSIKGAVVTDCGRGLRGNMPARS